MSDPGGAIVTRSATASTGEVARRQSLRPHRTAPGWVRDRGITARIARKGVDPSDRLGRHRWVIERTISWPTGYRRLDHRYDRKATHCLGFLTLAAALTGYKKLGKSKTTT